MDSYTTAMGSASWLPAVVLSRGAVVNILVKLLPVTAHLHNLTKDHLHLLLSCPSEVGELGVDSLGKEVLNSPKHRDVEDFVVAVHILVGEVKHVLQEILHCEQPLHLGLDMIGGFGTKLWKRSHCKKLVFSCFDSSTCISVHFTKNSQS